MQDKKKRRRPTVTEASIPAGVYPELDRDLGRDGPGSSVPPMNWIGPVPGMPGTVFPMGVYPVFDDDLLRDNTENNVTAANPEGVWPDPRLE